jgi:DNA-binding NtrC family response regulator
VAEKKQKNPSRSGEANTGSTTEAGTKISDLRIALEECEKQHILGVLEQNQGHKGKTAAMLGIDRKTLYTKLKKYGVQ